METFVTVVHVIVSIFMILVILLQSGKSAGMGGAFGGAGGAQFGASSQPNLLSRLTVAAATVFMITSLVLAWIPTAKSHSVVGDVEPTASGATGSEASDKGAGGE
ncbi:MAG: preprotein translocase subunit SecG, partial [Deltaproteobacteria bacterium]